jgi:tetratricopeptide (TPR) repeat protein
LEKYQQGNAKMCEIEFNEDVLLRHVEEAGITEEDQRFLINFRQKNTYIRPNLSNGFDAITIFCFKSKTAMAYFLKNSTVKEILQNGVSLLSEYKQNFWSPVDAFGSYICFMMGYLYEIGVTQLGIKKDLKTSERYYEKACSTKNVIKKENGDFLEQRHPGAMLLMAEKYHVEYVESKKTPQLEEALSMYDQVIAAENSLEKLNCGEHYYSANLAAAKLCLLHHEELFNQNQFEEAYCFIKKAMGYFEKARFSPIKNERMQAVEELYALAVKENNQPAILHYEKVLEDLGVKQNVNEIIFVKKEANPTSLTALFVVPPNNDSQPQATLAC